MTVMGLGYLTSATAKIPIRSFTFFIFSQIFFKFLFLNVVSPKEIATEIIMGKSVRFELMQKTKTY